MARTDDVVGTMWGRLLIETFERPRAAARRLLELRLPADALFTAAVAVSCAGLVMAWLAAGLSDGVDPLTGAMVSAPLLGAAMQFAILVAVVAATYHVGRMLGGKGDLAGSLAVVVWLNAVMVVIQLIQIAALVVAPPFATVIAIGTLLWVLWAFAAFVTELHGFSNPLLVLGGVILTVVVFFFGLVSLLAMLGLVPQGAA